MLLHSDSGHETISGVSLQWCLQESDNVAFACKAHRLAGFEDQGHVRYILQPGDASSLTDIARGGLHSSSGETDLAVGSPNRFEPQFRDVSTFRDPEGKELLEKREVGDIRDPEGKELLEKREVGDIRDPEGILDSLPIIHVGDFRDPEGP